MKLVEFPMKANADAVMDKRVTNKSVNVELVRLVEDWGDYTGLIFSDDHVEQVMQPYGEVCAALGME